MHSWSSGLVRGRTYRNANQEVQIRGNAISLA